MDKIVYHGSSKFFKIALPKLNKRMKKGKIIWKEVSFHATPNRYIALTYLQNKKAKFSYKGKKYYFGTGISLYKKDNIIEIYGINSLEYSLRKIFLDNKTKYLYLFDKKDFTYQKGLGKLEVVSLKRIKPLKVIRIKDPVKWIKKEKVRFKFTDITKIKREMNFWKA